MPRTPLSSWDTMVSQDTAGRPRTADPAPRRRDRRRHWRKDAKNLLGFTFFEVYSSTLKINARYVEAALQMRYQHLPLGLRLWRCPDKGPKYDKEIDGKLHKVFITCSPRVGQMLAERQIKVNF